MEIKWTLCAVDNNIESSFVSDVFARLDTRERIVSLSISHVHHPHVKMEVHAGKPATIPTNANVHQVSEYYILYSVIIYTKNQYKFNNSVEFRIWSNCSIELSFHVSIWFIYRKEFHRFHPAKFHWL